jgi:phospholipase C
LPYELAVRAAVDASNGSVVLTFLNTGRATVVFQVRSGNAADPVRTYTVEPHKQLAGTWNVGGSYDLSVYCPNGFARFFKGSTGANAAVLDVVPKYDDGDGGSIELRVANLTAAQASVSVLDAYTGNSVTRHLDRHESFDHDFSFRQFYGWYDLIVTVAGDPSFHYRLAGHVETENDNFSDPALGGLVALKA